MIDAVATVCIFVNDQDKAKAFYTDKLGFELRQDSPMGESRWIAVAPRGARTEVILYKLDEGYDVESTGISREIFPSPSSTASQQLQVKVQI